MAMALILKKNGTRFIINITSIVRKYTEALKKNILCGK